MILLCYSLHFLVWGSGDFRVTSYELRVKTYGYDLRRKPTFRTTFSILPDSRQWFFRLTYMIHENKKIIHKELYDQLSLRYQLMVRRARFPLK